MDRLDDMASYEAAHDTFLKLELCLQALDEIGCKIAALHVHTAMTSLQATMNRSPVSGVALQPDSYFAELQISALRNFGVGEPD